MKILREMNIDDLNKKIRAKGYVRARVVKKSQYDCSEYTIFVMVNEQNGVYNNLEILSDAIGQTVTKAYWKDEEKVLLEVESKFNLI